MLFRLGVVYSPDTKRTYTRVGCRLQMYTIWYEERISRIFFFCCCCCFCTAVAVFAWAQGWDQRIVVTLAMKEGKTGFVDILLLPVCVCVHARALTRGSIDWIFTSHAWWERKIKMKFVVQSYKAPKSGLNEMKFHVLSIEEQSLYKSRLGFFFLLFGSVQLDCSNVSLFSCQFGWIIRHTQGNNPWNFPAFVTRQNKSVSW